MNVTVLGAAHEVTGSCSLIKAGGKYSMIDCGMEQGANVFENDPLPVSAGDIEFVFLTHAHIDHSGMLPLLYKNGFRGQVCSTFETLSAGSNSLCTSSMPRRPATSSATFL